MLEGSLLLSLGAYAASYGLVAGPVPACLACRCSPAPVCLRDVDGTVLVRVHAGMLSVSPSATARAAGHAAHALRSNKGWGGRGPDRQTDKQTDRQSQILARPSAHDPFPHGQRQGRSRGGRDDCAPCSPGTPPALHSMHRPRACRSLALASGHPSSTDGRAACGLGSRGGSVGSGGRRLEFQVD